MGASAVVCNWAGKPGVAAADEYLAAENHILRTLLPARLRLSDPQRSTLAEIGKRLGRRSLAEVAVVAKPDMILARYRRLVAQKFVSGSAARWTGD
jgi:putative transposase